MRTRIPALQTMSSEYLDKGTLAQLHSHSRFLRTPFTHAEMLVSRLFAGVL